MRSPPTSSRKDPRRTGSRIVRRAAGRAAAPPAGGAAARGGPLCGRREPQAPPLPPARIAPSVVLQAAVELDGGHVDAREGDRPAELADEARRVARGAAR